MAKKKGLDRERAKALVDGLIASAEGYGDGERKARREMALEYQSGRMPDLEHDSDKSSAVEQLLSDAVAMVKPSLSRVFLSSDRIAIFEPVAPASMESMPGNNPREKRKAWDEECQRLESFASQATDYINHIFLRECIGEKIIGDLIYDGLLHGNGVVKHWWDKTPKYEVEQYTGLSDDDYVELASDPDVEVLEHSEYEATEDEADALASADADTDSAQPTGLGGPQGLGIPPQGSPVPGGPGGGPNPLGGQLPPSVPQAPPPNPMAAGGMGGQPGGMPGSLPPQGMDFGAMGGAPAPDNGVIASPSGDPAAVAMASGGISPFLGLDGPFLGLGSNLGPPPLLHDLKIRRLVSTGRLRIKCLADEDFEIEPGADALTEDECRYCAHVDHPTRSDLVERGYDQDEVWDIPSLTESTEDGARASRYGSATEEYADKAAERVEIREAYALMDLDDDGIAERYQVIVGGAGGSSRILSLEPWGGRLPFSDIVPDPVPHRWMGRSLYDLLRDPQRVATAIARRMYDNTYQAVEPMRAVDWSMIRNPDDLLNQRLGGIVEVKGDPRAAITDLVVPSIAQFAQPIIQEQRHIAERRTGVGEQSSGLDADALTGQVATAVTATQSAAGLRKEEMARNIAIGLRRAFSCILRLMVENQDRTTMMRLRNEWVEMDPRAWSAEMDVTINVGLGGGNRDRDLAMLQGIASKQEMVLQTLGPANPILSVKQLFETYGMMVEASGVKSPERFFPEISDEVIEQFKAQAAQPKPDPKAQAAQAQMQMAQAKMQMDAQMQGAKAQADQQLAQAKAQADGQLAAAKMQQAQAIMEAKLQADMRVQQAEMQHRMEMDRAKAQMDIASQQQKAQIELQVQQAKADAAMEIQRRKAEDDLRIRTMELQFEMQLKTAQAAAGFNRPNDTNLARPE